MKIGYRTPSLKKRISSRTSVKRYVRNNLGVKAQKGYGWLTNPKKYAYNKVYNKTTKDLPGCVVYLIPIIGLAAYLLLK